MAEWTIEVMKAARTSIFEPEVSYFIPAHVTTFSIFSVLVACGRCIYLALLQPLPLSLAPAPPTSSSFVFAYCKLSKLDSGEGLGTRLHGCARENWGMRPWLLLFYSFFRKTRWARMLKLVASPGSNQGRLNHSQEKTPRLETLSSSSSLSITLLLPQLFSPLSKYLQEYSILFQTENVL